MPRFNSERRKKPLTDKQTLRLIRARAKDRGEAYGLFCACGNYYTSDPHDSYTPCDLGHATRATTGS